MMDAAWHASLNTLATQALQFEAISTQLEQQAQALEREGLVGPPVMDLRRARALVLRQANRMKRECRRALRGTPVGELTAATHGLGDAVALFVGVCRPLADFPNPAKLWAYCGLCPGRGPKKGENHKYSRRLKAHAIKRLAEPCMKQKASPYRAVYDDRRARTAETRPDWTNGHSHNDALRITAKAILLDIWRVSHGLPPRVGHFRIDTQGRRAAPGAESANTSNGDGARRSMSPKVPLPHRQPSQDSAAAISMEATVRWPRGNIFDSEAKGTLAPSFGLPRCHTHRDEGGGHCTHDTHLAVAPTLGLATEDS